MMHPTSDQSLRLQLAIADLDIALDEFRRYFHSIAISDEAPPQLTLIKRFVFDEISELAVVLEMVNFELATLKEVDATLAKYPWGQGIIDEPTPQGRARAVLLRDRQRLGVERLSVHVKTIYEWLYHVREQMDRNQQVKSLLVPQLYERLKAVCDLRHGLITHKRRTLVYLMSSPRFSPSRGEFELLLTSMAPPKAAICRLDNLFAQCTPYLPAEEAAETNYYERLIILRRHLHELRSELRSQLVQFSERYGTITEQPAVLAELIRDLARDVLPKLAQL